MRFDFTFSYRAFYIVAKRAQHTSEKNNTEMMKYVNILVAEHAQFQLGANIKPDQSTVASYLNENHMWFAALTV